LSGKIWIFKDFRTASIVYGSVAIFGFILWKLFLEKTLKKAKTKVKNKAEKEVEKIFLPCDNMPEGIFKSKASYFSHDYITAVFEHSNKRM